MRSPSHAIADAVLRGEPITASPAWRDVASFLDDLRLESAATSAPTPSPPLEALLDRPTARVLRTAEPDARRRTRVLLRLRPVAALCAASCVTFGGLAAAGALPGPLQHAGATFGSRFGVGIPGATRIPRCRRPMQLPRNPPATRQMRTPRVRAMSRRHRRSRRSRRRPRRSRRRTTRSRSPPCLRRRSRASIRARFPCHRRSRCCQPRWIRRTSRRAPCGTRPSHRPRNPGSNNRDITGANADVARSYFRSSSASGCLTSTSTTQRRFPFVFTVLTRTARVRAERSKLGFGAG